MVPVETSSALFDVVRRVFGEVGRWRRGGRCKGGGWPMDPGWGVGRVGRLGAWAGGMGAAGEPRRETEVLPCQGVVTTTI